MDKSFDKLADIIGQTLKVPRERIVREALLKEDLNADSIDASSVLMDVEQAFDVIVPDREREYRTVGDIADHLNELLAAKTAVQSAMETC